VKDILEGMLFSSFVFLFFFLPLFLLGYYLVPKRWKNAFILLCSLVFYAWGAPKFVLLLVGSSFLDYIFSQQISHHGRQKTKKILLFFSIFFNASLLLYFKYANFFVSELNHFLQFFDIENISLAKIILPIGISFFTFQKISYLVDVYRKIAKPAPNFSSYLLYVVLFPQLIAGPIIRYHDIHLQIQKREHTREKFLEGVYRFCIGLAKKVLIADILAGLVNPIFDLPSSDLTMVFAWLGAIAYALQIYFDFSGYSDMAIGLCKMMGFDIPENFHMPYISRNFTEFWRRWHISLSQWMKEYLYIPLGGNRVSSARMYLNLWIVFLLSGLWHGASTTFIFWGAFHGFFLMLDKMFWLRISEYFKTFFNTLLTFLLLCLSWIFFRADTIADAFLYLQKMFFGTNVSQTLLYDFATNRSLFMLAIALCISFFPAFRFYKKIQEMLQQISLHKILHGKFIFSLVLLFMSILSMANASFNPFIYFRF